MKRIVNQLPKNFTKNPSFRRWVDIFFVSIALNVIIYGANKQLGDVSQICLNFLSNWSSILEYTVICLVVATISFGFTRLGGSPPNFTLSIMIRYPPFWFAAIAPAVMLYIKIFERYSLKLIYVNTSELLFLIASIMIGGLIGFLHIYLSTPSENGKLLKVVNKPNQRSFLSEDRDLQSWILEEIPIQSPEEDMFSLRLTAKRIAKLLLKESFTSIGIIGPYGSGKSSLINLVEYFLKHKRKLLGHPDESISYREEILCCRLDGWGYANGSIAPKILTCAIEKAKEYVDCLSVVNLPENYCRAISGANFKGGSALTAFLQTFTDPVVQLTKLDNILEAAQLRIVIILEDLDRNTSDITIKDEIPSLLDKLRVLGRISFVLAIGTEHHYSDILNRICNQIEAVGTLSENYLSNTILSYRGICLNAYPKDIHIDNYEQTKAFWETSLHNPFFDYSSPIDAVYRLIKTPRILKLILRRTFRGWSVLHGEIHFDEMLIVNILRYSAPEAFEFILENIQELRGLASSEEENRLKSIEKKWAQICKIVKWDVISAKQLIQFLFPNWKHLYAHPAYDTPLQGMHSSIPVDYWLRLLFEEVEMEAIRDQEVIQSLQAWKIEPQGCHFKGVSLPYCLCTNNEFVRKFERFVPKIFNVDEIRNLTSMLFSEALNIYGVSANSRIILGFLPLWRQVGHPSDEYEHLNWVKEEFLKVLPFSLRLANDIYHYWGTNSKIGVGFLPNSADFEKEIVLATKKHFIGNPERLIKTLDPLHIYSSYHFYSLLSFQPDTGDSMLGVKEWKWFADLLIEAGNINPEIIVPQVVGMLINKNSVNQGNVSYNFKQSFAEEFFGDKLSSVMKLLATKIDSERFEYDELNQIKYANELATKWLTEQGKLDLINDNDR